MLNSVGLPALLKCPMKRIADTIRAAAAIAKKDPFHAKGLRSYTLKPWQVNEGGFGVRLIFSTQQCELK
jgi:hypothetical protein